MFSPQLAPHLVPTVHDPRKRKLELREQFPVRRPFHLLPATSVIQPVTPCTSYLEVYQVEGSRVERDAVVLVVTSQFRAQGLVLVFNRVVAMVTAPLPERTNATIESAAVGFPFNDVPSLPGFAPVMGKAQKVKRAWFGTVRLSRVVASGTTKRDHTGLFRIDL